MDVPAANEGVSSDRGRSEGPASDEKDTTADRPASPAGVAEGSTTGVRPGGPAVVAWG